MTTLLDELRSCLDDWEASRTAGEERLACLLLAVRRQALADAVAAADRICECPTTAPLDAILALPVRLDLSAPEPAQYAPLSEEQLREIEDRDR
jgi:hypothetical protein